jgi:hypothetical protein
MKRALLLAGLDQVDNLRARRQLAQDFALGAPEDEWCDESLQARARRCVKPRC